MKYYFIFKDWLHVDGRRIVEKKTILPIKAHSELNAILKYKIMMSKKRYEYASYIRYTKEGFYYGGRTLFSEDWIHKYYAVELC